MVKRIHYMLLALCTTGATAQVVAPVEISDPALRALQQSTMPQLKLVAHNAATHKFDYNFYFTRKLDIDEKQQRSSDQHSIRFEHYNGLTVLAISGNYFGAYPTGKFTEGQRARRTFFSVILPLAKAAVPVLQDDPDVQGFAFEVSHHVIGKTMGLAVEHPENLMVYLPRAAAMKLVTAPDRASQQAALLGSQVFLNAVPLSLWLSDEGAPSRSEVENTPPVTLKPASLESMSVRSAPAVPLPDAPEPVAIVPPASSKPITVAPPVVVAAAVPKPESTVPVSVVVPKDISPGTLAALQSANQAASNHLAKDLAQVAHLIPYAPPAFISFHNQVYLELSLSTVLPENAGSSRYKMAALTFDEQISPLIRRVLTYFTGKVEFDGISFSSTVQVKSRPGTHPPAPMSIEFFLSLSSMRRYESFDLTGQELLNSGLILINGERVGIDLQMAESDGRM